MLSIPLSIFLFVCHFMSEVEPFLTHHNHKSCFYQQSALTMSTDHTPVLSNNVRANVAKNSLFCLGSMLSVALLKRDKAVAIDLPECSDSVTIFRRAADNHEVSCK